MSPRPIHQNIGSQLRNARLSEGLTLKEVTSAIKIRSELLVALEDDNFAIFGSEVFAKGMLKNYATFLKLDTARIMALFRKEQFEVQSGKKVKVPQFLISKISSKNLLIGLVTTIFVTTVLIYLVAQIARVFDYPTLTISDPLSIQSDQEITEVSFSTTEDRVEIQGQTTANTVITVNGNITPLDHFFQYRTGLIPLPNETNNIRIVATNQFGRSRTILLSIVNLSLSKPDETITAKVTVLRDISNHQVLKDTKEVSFGAISAGEVIEIVADQELVIHVTEPQNLQVEINGSQFILKEKYNSWQITDEQINHTSKDIPLDYLPD